MQPGLNYDKHDPRFILLGKVFKFIENKKVKDIYNRNGIKNRAKFVIYLKNDDIIEIPYNNLFKARSKKRVLRQEEKISNIIKEFNLFSNSK